MLDQNKTVLIVDDNMGTRALIQLALERLGYRTLVAVDGASGLDVYKRCQPEISLVLLDAKMPGMDGAELYRTLREYNPAVKCLIISGYAAPSREVETLKDEGVLGFIRKPFSPKTLAKHVRAALGSGSSTNQELH